jgi:hypothetical protein
LAFAETVGFRASTGIIDVANDDAHWVGHVDHNIEASAVQHVIAADFRLSEFDTTGYVMVTEVHDQADPIGLLGICMSHEATKGNECHDCESAQEDTCSTFHTDLTTSFVPLLVTFGRIPAKLELRRNPPWEIFSA